MAEFFLATYSVTQSIMASYIPAKYMRVFLLAIKIKPLLFYLLSLLCLVEEFSDLFLCLCTLIFRGNMVCFIFFLFLWFSWI